MNRQLGALWLIAGIFTATTSSAQTLCIRVCNRAHVRTAELNSALLETTRLFKPTEIRITWQLDVESPEDGGIDMSSAPKREPDPRRYLVVTLLTGSPATVCPGALGFALPSARSGAHASIFYDRVEATARAESVAGYVALGSVMAHELGHVLLRSNEHSRAGLMQTGWNRATWRLASEGLLRFLPEQREWIRNTASVIDSASTGAVEGLSSPKLN